MRYGLDHRDSGTLNDTDLGVARFMIEQSELPHARAVPIRTLYAQLREAILASQPTETPGICTVTSTKRSAGTCIRCSPGSAPWVRARRP